MGLASGRSRGSSLPIGFLPSSTLARYSRVARALGPVGTPIQRASPQSLCPGASSLLSMGAPSRSRRRRGGARSDGISGISGWPRCARPDWSRPPRPGRGTRPPGPPRARAQPPRLSFRVPAGAARPARRGTPRPRLLGRPPRPHCPPRAREEAPSTRRCPRIGEQPAEPRNANTPTGQRQHFFFNQISDEIGEYCDGAVGRCELRPSDMEEG